LGDEAIFLARDEFVSLQAGQSDIIASISQSHYRMRMHTKWEIKLSIGPLTFLHACQYDKCFRWFTVKT